MPQSNLYVGVAGYVGRPKDVGAVGVFRRRADGGQWEHVLASHEVYSIFVHPKDANLVFAGTSDGVWRSVDRGASFQRTDFADADKQVWSLIAIDESQPHVCRCVADRRLSLRGSRRELAPVAQPRDQGTMRGSLRPTGDADGPASWTRG